MEDSSKYISMKMKPFLFRRWWLRVRPCAPEMVGTLQTAPNEFYVPWWSWVFELTHRLIFGRNLLKD